MRRGGGVKKEMARIVAQLFDSASRRCTGRRNGAKTSVCMLGFSVHRSCKELAYLVRKNGIHDVANTSDAQFVPRSFYFAHSVRGEPAVRVERAHDRSRDD